VIIFLNGTSSSGKSSIAEQLLRVLPTPYFHLPVDAINSLRARERTLELGPAELADVLEKTVLGFHRVVAGMAAAGNDVVVDHVLRERHWLRDCLTVLKDHEVVFVGVHCPLGELIRREQERGDRQPGRAAYHFDRVHAHCVYDVECDTSVRSPVECALQIKDFLDHGRSPTAFGELQYSTEA
jgi:chloramphenicol 3-O phosphotransferase